MADRREVFELPGVGRITVDVRSSGPPAVTVPVAELRAALLSQREVVAILAHLAEHTPGISPLRTALVLAQRVCARLEVLDDGSGS